MKNCFIRMMPWGVPAIADLTNLGEMVPHTMTITRINVPWAFRGQGHGSALLRQITEEADQEAIDLSLEIMPSGPLNYEQLASWYRRYGFLPSARYTGIFIRRPRSPYV